MAGVAIDHTGRKRCREVNCAKSQTARRLAWSAVMMLFCVIAETTQSFTTLNNFHFGKLRHSILSPRGGLLAENKDLSAAEKERRDEEERRRLRRDDVVIGKTSAKKGEKDFPLDPKATQEEYLRQATRIEQEVFQLTEDGMEFLNSLQIEKADKEFSKVFELKSNAYLWQAGIVKFYLGDIVEAGRLFARSAEQYESRFGIPATEERIWRDACALKFQFSQPALYGMRNISDTPDDIIPRIKDMVKSDDILGVESRKVLKLARDLFSSSLKSDNSGVLLARAKLRSIGGSDRTPRADPKMWKLNSWFFLGLYYDAVDMFDESKKCMKMALRLCPSSGKSDDIIHTLPLLHMTARDWFDDDDFDAEIVFEDEIESEATSFTPKQPNKAIASMAYADPLIEKSIKEGVSKMKRRELKEALRLRGKITTGSKEELQERLFYSLMDDAGFASGFSP